MICPQHQALYLCASGDAERVENLCAFLGCIAKCSDGNLLQVAAGAEDFGNEVDEDAPCLDRHLVHVFDRDTLQVLCLFHKLVEHIGTERGILKEATKRELLESDLRVDALHEEAEKFV